jgi:HEAT repeat protein
MNRQTFIALTMLCADAAHPLAAAEDPAPPTDPAKLLEAMRGLSMQFAPGSKSDGSIDAIEQRRHQIAAQWRALVAKGIPVLAHALTDSDVQLRRNATLVLIHLAGGYDEIDAAKIDIRTAAPALIKATTDQDADVRAWAAGALAEIGPAAAPAVPALIQLLHDPQEGPRNGACLALRGIGPAARDALPALRDTLHDPSADTRKFAALAITAIER